MRYFYFLTYEKFIFKFLCCMSYVCDREKFVYILELNVDLNLFR